METRKDPASENELKWFQELGPWSLVPASPNARKNGPIPEKVLGTAEGSYSGNEPHVSPIHSSLNLWRIHVSIK